MYTMEVFDTLKEKNAMVMSVYCVTEYTTESHFHRQKVGIIYETQQSTFLNLLFFFHGKHVLVMHTVGKKALDTI